VCCYPKSAIAAAVVWTLVKGKYCKIYNMTFIKPSFVGKDFSFRVVQINARESYGVMFISWISCMYDHALWAFCVFQPA
jgi:acyl dehydratase